MTNTQFSEHDQVLDAIPDLVMVLDRSHRIVYANKAMLARYGENVIGRKCWEIIHHTDGPVPECPHAALLRDGREHIFEISENSLGQAFLVSATPLHDVDGSISGCVHVVRDITQRKETEAAIAQKNAALHELIEQIAAEKDRVRKSIAENIEEVVIPLLSRLRLKDASHSYVDQIKYHLRDIVSTQTKDISQKSIFRLTPREKEICDMIKAGLTSKEIAKLLFLSVQTVHRHRRNIRHQLRLTGKKQNLASFLREQ